MPMIAGRRLFPRINAPANGHDSPSHLCCRSHHAVATQIISLGGGRNNWHVRDVIARGSGRTPYVIIDVLFPHGDFETSSSHDLGSATGRPPYRA